VLHGVALLALLSAASACGRHSSATILRITVRNGPGVHAFTLRCEPLGGTAPQPASICAELRRSPKMLARGRALGNSCPGGNVRREVEVEGRYRGEPVDAAFSVGGCVIVVGQDAAPATWWYLMHGASV
jgi:Subtilisin inhibitor-like